MKKNIQFILDNKHSLSREFISKLDSSDIKELLGRLKVRKENDPATSFLVNAMAKAAPEKLLPELTKIVQLRKNEQDLLTAVKYLGQIGGPKEEKHLLKLMELRDQSLLRSKTALALGSIGTKASVKPLLEAALSGGTEKPAARLGLFLLASRLQHPWNEIREADFLEGTRFIKPSSTAKVFPIKPVMTKTAESALENLSDTFGMKFSGRNALKFKCGQDDHLLVMNSAYDITPVHRAGNAMASPAAVLMKSPTDNSWSVRFLVFLAPGKNGVSNVYVLRTDGHRVLQGTQVGNRFNLETVDDRPVAAMRLSGIFSGGKISEPEILSESLVKSKRIPAPSIHGA
jgi:hypothetical protein